MGVHHEPGELSGQLGSPAEAHGPGRGDSAAGGRHLGGLLRADLRKDPAAAACCCSLGCSSEGNDVKHEVILD